MAKKAYRQQMQLPSMRRIRVASWIFIGVFALVPMGGTAAAIVFAFAGVDARSEANIYNSAPTCAPVGPPATTPCRRMAAAVVESAFVVRSGKSVTTSVSLLVAADRVQRTTLSGDQSGALAAGTAMTVTLWGTSIARIADSAGAWTTQDSPIYHADNDVTVVISTLPGSLVYTRILGWAVFGRRVVRHRFALADLAVGLCVVTVTVLSVVHLAKAAAYLTPVAAALLAASVTLWPRVTWVRRPGK